SRPVASEPSRDEAEILTAVGLATRRAEREIVKPATIHVTMRGDKNWHLPAANWQVESGITITAASEIARCPLAAHSADQHQAHGLLHRELGFAQLLLGQIQRIAADLVAHGEVHRDELPVARAEQLGIDLLLGDEADQLRRSAAPQHHALQVAAL